MKYILSLLAALLLMPGCASQKTVLSKHALVVNSGNIVVWTYNLNIKMRNAVDAAAKILNKDIFSDRRNCNSILVKHLWNHKASVDGPPPLHDGINIYNSYKAPGVKKYTCAYAYNAVSRSKKKSVINLCHKRIDRTSWRHAVDPDLYLVMHMMSKALGLPSTNSLPKVASYSSNDSLVRSGTAFGSPSSALFRFKSSEIKALRKRYCQ